MKKRLITVVMMILTLQGTMAQEDMLRLYESILEMQVASFRLSRDKLYEIYHPDFDLLPADMAQAVSLSEDMMSQITEAVDGTEWERQFGAVEDVWNHLRLAMIGPLEPAEYTRFYYDCVTLDRYLDVLADTLEARLEVRYPHVNRIRNQYNLRKHIFLVNTGYMTRHHRLAASMQNILPQSLPRLKEQLASLKKDASQLDGDSIQLLASILNEWNFFEYNLGNVLFSPEKTLFTMANTLNLHVYLLFKTPKTSGR